ncbi:IS630 transposase-related protein, partial [Streptococcus suis]
MHDSSPHYFLFYYLILGKFREFLEVPYYTYEKLMKSYGIDFRKRVIAYVETGHSKKETCQLFGISTNTLYLWE